MANDGTDKAEPPDDTLRPTHGRAGRGVASILPHLNRQQRINDKPAPTNVKQDSQPQQNGDAKT